MDNYNNISGISPEKLNLLSEIIRQSENVSSENLIPFFLNAAATANAKGINFSDSARFNSYVLWKVVEIVLLSKNAP